MTSTQERQEGEPLVLVEAHGPVLVVTLNRPEKRNATNAEVLCRLYDAWVRLDSDPSLRVGVLTGRGSTFCAGMDLAEIGRLREGRPTTSGSCGSATSRRAEPPPARQATGRK